jgi:hypothetical protein
MRGALGVALLVFQAQAQAPAAGGVAGQLRADRPPRDVHVRLQRAEQTLTVPSSVESVHVDAVGAHEAGGDPTAPDRCWATATAAVAVTPIVYLQLPQRQSEREGGRRFRASSCSSSFSTAPARSTTSKLIAVRKLPREPGRSEGLVPPRSSATACTANESRCRCPGCCSARPLSGHKQPRRRGPYASARTRDVLCHP